MNSSKTKIRKVLRILENKKERFSRNRFFQSCKVVKREILTAFEEGELTLDEAKPLLRRVNVLLARGETEKKGIMVGICPGCGAENTAQATFCKNCGLKLKK
ncbi:MAG: zinc ribbon domain-containing protein [Euryarchaeota archaeon]|nr:zinc ribbon domain-containing protein [Euryarchaeota archaeon]